MYQYFFIHSPSHLGEWSSTSHLVDGHLGCFHVLAIINSTAVKNGIHVSLSILVYSGYMSKSGIAGSLVVLFLVF